MKCIILFWCLLFCQLFSLGAVKPPRAVSVGVHRDKLRPELHAKTLEFRRYLDEWISGGGAYQCSVNVEESASTLFTRRSTTRYVHKVAVPRQIGVFVDSLSKEFVAAMFNRFLNDSERSFYCAVLFIAKWQDHGTGMAFPNVISPISETDKAMWDKEKRTHFLNFAGLATEYKTRVSTLFDSVPDIYKNAVFQISHAEKNEMVFKSPGRAWFSVYSEYTNAVARFAATGDVRMLQRIPCDQYHAEEWARLMIQKFAMKLDTDLWITDAVFATPGNAKAFAAWARPHAAKNPALVSLAFGFLILDGYEFDDATGNYILNGIGKTHLDLITAFPDKENAARLKILMDGGNETLIESLMEKHKTTASWQKIFGEA